MKEDTPSAYMRLRSTVEVEITQEDAHRILHDKASKRASAEEGRPLAGISMEEWRYVQEAIREMEAGEYTSTVLLPNKRKINN